MYYIYIYICIRMYTYTLHTISSIIYSDILSGMPLGIIVVLLH